MTPLADFLKKYEGADLTKPPPHWKADIVNQIIDLCGMNRKYEKFDGKTQFRKTYSEWLGMIKQSGKSWGDCMDILKTAGTLKPPYGKGGFIHNKLIGKKK